MRWAARCRIAFGRRRLTAADRKFLQFHVSNLHVYRILVRLARQAMQSGRTKIGIGMLYERMRWELFITTSGDDYKLNNNYRSRYARLIMSKESDLVDAFEVRQLKS